MDNLDGDWFVPGNLVCASGAVTDPFWKQVKARSDTIQKTKWVYTGNLYDFSLLHVTSCYFQKLDFWKWNQSQSLETILASPQMVSAEKVILWADRVMKDYARKAPRDSPTKQKAPLKAQIIPNYVYVFRFQCWFEVTRLDFCFSGDSIIASTLRKRPSFHATKCKTCWRFVACGTIWKTTWQPTSGKAPSLTKSPSCLTRGALPEFDVPKKPKPKTAGPRSCQIQFEENRTIFQGKALPPRNLVIFFFAGFFNSPGVRPGFGGV